jgi:RND family efflux transporter MFP subunit
MSPRQSISSALIRFGMPVGILAAGVAVFAAIGRKPAAPPRAVTAVLAPLVETAPVELDESGLELQVDGTVTPHREIGLAAEVEGRVTHKAAECRAGRYVTKGTLLYEIDPRNHELEVERLQKELGQADVTILELDVETENAATMITLAEEECVLQQRQLQRAKNVFSKGATTDSSLDEAKRAELTARNTLQTLKNQWNMLRTRHARLEQAKELVAARLAQAQLELERTRVTAPVDGMIVSDAVEQDDYVQRGTLLANLEDTSAVDVKCSFRMEELDWLWRHAASDQDSARGSLPAQDYELPETPVTVIYRLRGREYTWEGVLSRYDGIGLDEKTRTVPCRVLVPRPREVRLQGSQHLVDTAGPRALTRGMYVKVRVEALGSRAMLRLPQRGVQPGNVVWRVRDGRLDVVPVEVASLRDDTVLIEAGTGGLRAADRVVVSPLVAATDGMAVREADQR